MHDPQLREVIIRIGAVHGAPVIPNDEVGVAPQMAILKLRLEGEIVEGVEQCVAILVAPAEDAFDPVRIDVEQLATGDRMRADQGMFDIRRIFFFNLRLLSDPRLVTAAEILVYRAEPLDPLSEVRRQRI